MKKYFKVFITLIILILCGCSNNIILNISSNNITNIVYDNIKISNSDFDRIVNQINNKDFYDLENINVNGKKLLIDTSEYSYDLEVFDNFLVYNHGNKRYYSKVESISKLFDEIITKYENNDFFKIELISNYNVEDSDYLMKLDDSNQYIIIKTLLNIYDFEIINNNYVVNTQNKINKIDSNKIICIETNSLNNINIRFKSPYNYQVNITYDNGFVTNIKKPD